MRPHLAGFIACGLCLAFAGSTIHGQDELSVTGDKAAALLSDMAGQTRANFELLQTWQAEFRFRDGNVTQWGYQVDGKKSQTPLWSERTGIVRLAFNRTSKEFFSNYAADGPQRFSQLDGGAAWDSPTLALHRQTIVTPADSYTFRDNWQNSPREGDPIRWGWKPQDSRVIERESPTEALRYSGFGPVVDPNMFFDVGGPPVWTALSNMARVSPHSPHQRVAMRFVPDTDRQQVEVSLELNAGADAAPLRLKYQFDLQAGGHPVEASQWQVNPDRLIARRRWKWVQHEGIWLPDEFWLQTFDFSNKLGAGTETRQVDRLFNLKSTAANRQLGQHEFGWQRFDLKSGDRVIDVESKTMSVVTASGQLATPQEFAIPAGDPRGSAILFATIVNGAILGVIGLVWLVRRYFLRRTSVTMEHS